MGTQSLFDPENYSTGGGGIEDADVTVIAAQALPGSETRLASGGEGDAKEKLFAVLTLQTDEEGAEPKDEYWSIGKLEKFSASADRSRIVTDTDARMNQNAKWALFCNSLVKAGFNKKDFPTDNSLGFLVGQRFHVKQVPMPISGKPLIGKDGKPIEPKVLIVTAILEAKKGKGAKGAGAGGANASKGGTKPAAEEAAGDDEALTVEMTVQMAIYNAIAAKGGTYLKRDLPTLMMKEFAKRQKDLPAALKFTGDAAWLGAEDRPWQYDAGAQSFKAAE